MNRFQRNPKKTIFVTVLVLIILIDLIAGKILIDRHIHPFRIPHFYYHHDLLPNADSFDSWGDEQYKFYTNSLGFRDKEIREVPLTSSKKRILFIGDSFTEAVGVTYEESFVGLLEKQIDTSKTEVLNAGVISYSPKLDYLKVRYLLEEAGLAFNELFIFIDISDPQDEVIYRNFQRGKLKWCLNKTKKFIRSNSFIAYSLHNIMKRRINYWGNDVDLSTLDYPADSLPFWTLNDISFQKWGEPGLELAQANMDSLLSLCKKRNIKISLAVYPWPEQILFNDLNSIQVKFWKDFCEQNQIAFINLFPAFIQQGQDKDSVIKKFYIKGDMHWNQAGHQLVAKEVSKFLIP